MLSSFRRPLTALAAASVAAAGLTACGGDEAIPGNAVVRVGDVAIKKAAYEHWLDVNAVAQAAQSDPTAAQTGKKPKVTIPDSPDFKACIAQKAKSAPKPPKGQPKPSTALFKTQCKTDYENLRNTALQFLITSQWIEREAAERSIKVTDAAVKKQFTTTKKQSFPKDADYQKFLTSSGMTEADLLFRVKLDLLSNKLREMIIKGKDKVTDAQIKAYYDKNKARFAQPELRDLRIIRTKTEAKAAAAKAQLDGGKAFKAVAQSTSIDEATKATGGALPGVSKGQQEPAFDKAAFAAPKGKLSGPVETPNGFYVFEVTKIVPAAQQTLKDSSAQIKQLLASQGQQKALDSFSKGFQKKWKAQTQCQDGFVTQECQNAPKAKTVPAGAPATGATG